jgi:hypothetical protein
MQKNAVALFAMSYDGVIYRFDEGALPKLRVMLLLIEKAVVRILTSASRTRTDHDGGDESPFVKVV